MYLFSPLIPCLNYNLNPEVKTRSSSVLIVLVMSFTSRARLKVGNSEALKSDRENHALLLKLFIIAMSVCWNTEV